MPASAACSQTGKSPGWLGAWPFGDRLRGLAREIEDPEPVGLSAAVALLRAEIAKERGVRDLFPIRREGAGARARHRQLHRAASLGAHAIEVILNQGPTIAQTPEQHPLSVGRPAIDLVVVTPPLGERPSRGIKRELPGHTARHRHHVDLLISVVLPGEGDRLSVGRELGEELETGMSRQPGCCTPAHRGQPEIAAVGEDDLVAVDVGEAEQLGLSDRRGRNCHQEADSQRDAIQHGQ